jgi:hypothetical protein
VRHTDDYGYQNLYLFRTIYSSEGREYSDTVNVQLADALGQWNGSGMSNLKTLDIPIGRSAVRFTPGERYTLLEGAGIPRLDIIGYAGRVNWSQLIEQVASQIQSGGTPIRVP